MGSDQHAVHETLGLAWVESMGGPLVVVPVSALHQWGGCTENGMVAGGGDQPDDYDRACEVEGLAEVISLSGHSTAAALVLGDEPSSTYYLAEQRAFVRWLAADSDAELIAAAQAVLNDPATPWEDCGVWRTDGPAVLMDSGEAGSSLGVPYPDGRGQPEQAPVHVPAGHWRVRVFHDWSRESTWVGVVQLLPA
ncbi:immunity protein 21 of polymorphic toxin system [Kitasatospora sp. SolWspMP-SS2h]|uniref:Imm21 family immunity protein n=1 Tax=Kitasatospora sp. SolWspMP-SS2h TaxID=1305729 RepID=UPI000DBFEBB5|nr:Imm21 family immunity protein [Kitasatospora sp. SolWspMP-SS2h]RAJ38363.1 immunity protein 21 of polymorphic toxin system [Kitasatospora sp. SolWspMP-SS2h]